MSSSSSSPTPVPASVLQRLSAIVGERGVITDPDLIAPFCISWRDNWQGVVPMVVQPANTQELAEVVKVCSETRTPVVPQGGNTGLTGASQPHADGSEVIVSTTRMNKVRSIDLANDTITVEAGCVLQTLQQVAADNDRLLPLSLAAQGSCQIGGNLSTNAGGTQVVRYGNARNLVLGLEVVLADGRIWDGLRGLRKDNTGYDLKQFFIGAEGTLGFITAAVLRLWPKISDTQTAMVALPSAGAAVELLQLARRIVGDQVTAFELMHRDAFCLTLDHLKEIGREPPEPLGRDHEWTVLMDIAGQGEPGTLREATEQLLGEAMEQGLVTNAVIAESEDQGARLWVLRETLPEAQNGLGVSVKHDVSVPISSIADFVEQANAALQAQWPGVRPMVFGHVGDGNLHYNIAQPIDADPDVFREEYAKVNQVVHDIVMARNGSISAEHGLGRLRMFEAERYKSDVELDLMRTVKRALDPNNILNPGKVVRLDR